MKNLLPCRGSNPGPAEPEADMLPSEPARRANEAVEAAISISEGSVSLEHGCARVTHCVTAR